MGTFDGSLESFRLGDIVGLIAAGGKFGVLKVDSDRMTGRIFIADGGVTFATTREIEASDRPRRSVGLSRISEDRRSRRLRADPTFSGGDAVEQQIVEVFVRLRRDHRGRFSFVPGVTPSGGGAEKSPFDVDAIIAQADAHIEQWRRIETLVPDPHAVYRVAPELPAGQFEVTIDPRSWVFLAAAGEGSSVHELADRLGIFEFPTAVQVAEMVRRGLLVPVEESPELLVETSFQPAMPETVSAATGTGPAPEIDPHPGNEQ